MSAIGRAISELWGLFVEDASLTVAIALCVLLAWFIFPVLAIRVEWRGGGMFALLAVALIENVWRTSRR